MVGKRFGMPGRLACWGATCLTWCGLMLIGSTGFGEDQKEPTEKPKETVAKETPVDVVTFAKVEGTDATENAEERQAVEKAILDFANEFNAHNLEAVAAHYSSQAEITDIGGKVTRGRDAIHGVFEKLFKEQPEIKIQLSVQSLRFLSPELAIEDGTSTMTSGSGAAQTAHQDRYTVTHVKHDGKWLIGGARDWAPTPLSAEAQLQQLDWLVGEWVDENSDTLVHTTYYWSEDKRYLFSKYSVQRAGQPRTEGLQRIGWDPHRQQLHSWTFNNTGGFTEGLWSRSGDHWIVKITGVLGDGRVRSATNILTRHGPDHASYQSRDRINGGEVQPDLAPVPIVRKPPQPSLPKSEVPAAAQAEDKAATK